MAILWAPGVEVGGSRISKTVAGGRGSLRVLSAFLLERNLEVRERSLEGFDGGSNWFAGQLGLVDDEVVAFIAWYQAEKGPMGWPAEKRKVGWEEKCG